MNTTASTSPAYQLCSFRVRSGDNDYRVYELRQSSEPISLQAYQRELLEFCLLSQQLSPEEVDERMESIEQDDFSEWAYDDRIYYDPDVKNITKDEYDVLSRYL